MLLKFLYQVPVKEKVAFFSAGVFDSCFCIDSSLIIPGNSFWQRSSSFFSNLFFYSSNVDCWGSVFETSTALFGFSIEEGALYSNHWRHHVHISLNLSANFSTSLINQKMLGISYGEIFVIIGATAALIGPKDLPIIARTAGRLAGRAVGYVQVARGQFDSVMQQSQVNQVHKELQDTMAQLEAIRYEIRNISIMNPVPFTRRLEGMELPTKNGAVLDERSDTDRKHVLNIAKDLSSAKTNSSSLYSEALAYGRLAETPIIKSSSPQTSQEKESLNDRDGLLSVLPISAESAGLLPRQNGNLKGSDIVLESIVEAEVARNAKQFFSRPENQVPKE